MKKVLEVVRMFQNIKEAHVGGKHKGAGVFANVFSIQNIPLYIMSFMISMVGVGTGGQFQHLVLV